MFLDVTRRRNPQLIEAAKYLHQSGQILPDTYVLDLDVITENAIVLKECADQAGIRLFYMTKQIGRNPLVAARIRSAGIDKAVVVDYKEARTMMAHGLPIGNVGHLVQVPRSYLETVLCDKPEFVTVYSVEMLQEIERICKARGLRQKVLIKVLGAGDAIYEGQQGGFRIADLPQVARLQFDAITLAGLTSFPCFLLNEKQNIVPTQNVETLKAAQELFRASGVEIQEVNMPSATCCETIPVIRELGGTQGEPGHAFTGTTPLHAIKDLPERPALVYVSEISHHLDDSSYFYGGGYYRRGHFTDILIADGQTETICAVRPFSAEHIDYYLETEGRHAIGATVLGAFRTQIFTTRSDVAVVSGIQSGTPRLEGLYDSGGRALNG
ncbi:MAG: YhfX family PLP-dependent enzyme [Oscillospiraceae bacterium]|nr:YhfX family PLP-dependent enzyme [Oscillospiraceae bacterium]